MAANTSKSDDHNSAVEEERSDELKVISYGEEGSDEVDATRSRFISCREALSPVPNILHPLLSEEESVS